MILSADFRAGARDYRFLLDKGYPVDASIKLVGDRYRLDTSCRMILFRGILSGDLSRSNAQRLIRGLEQESRIAVDGYNVLFTITNYLRGHPLFVSTDGFLRDAGGAHGRVADAAQFLAAADELCASLAALGIGCAAIYLDAPVSRSAEHAAVLRNALTSRGVDGEVRLVPGADGFVAAWEGDAAVTSDSAIVAKAKAPLFDLARHMLETRYGASFPDLSEIFPPLCVDFTEI